MTVSAWVLLSGSRRLISRTMPFADVRALTALVNSLVVSRTASFDDLLQAGDALRHGNKTIKSAAPSLSRFTNMVLIRRSLSDADSGIDAREAKCPGARGSGICQAGVPALQKCLLAAMFLAQVALGSGQNVAQTGTSPGQETRARQGVVVENVASGSEGAKAGLQAGDVLLAWSRSGEGGRIESPFDLTDVETEQAPRGPVTVEGRRGTEKQSWTMGPSIWGVKARPDLNATPLRSYEEGQELTRSGKVDEAALVWRKAASQLDSSPPGWLRSWFLAQAADKLVTEH